MHLHRPLIPIVIVSIAVATLTGCGPAGSIVRLQLTGAGCDPDGLALPAEKIVLEVTNEAGPGEFDIQNEKGDSVAKINAINQGETKQLQVDLPTGYYTIECRTDDSVSRLTVGTPPEPPVDLGSVAAPDVKAPAGYDTTDGNNYLATNLVASSAAYDPAIVDPSMVDAWGLANRPAGKGGHIWVAANKTGTSLEYVGDVGGTPLNQQDLKVISVPGSPDTDPGAPANATQLGQPTGVIFNTASTRFVVDQGVMKLPAKFIFAGQDGTISAWTEQANPNGSTTQLAWATRVVDDSEQKAQYFGLAITPDQTRLLVADFGDQPGIKSFDADWKSIPTEGFENPFLKGAVKPNSLLPWNVTTIGDHVYVSFAEVGADETNSKAPSIGEENHAAGAGRIVEYNNDGSLVKVLDDKGSLDAPWGVSIAPPGFGKLAGDLLIANFGDGTISAFDAQGKFVDYVRGSDGKPLVNAGIWALLPGNGVSLGDAAAVYFTAGPDAEQEGVFGRIDAQ